MNKMLRHRIIDTLTNFYKEMLKVDDPIKKKALKYRFADSVLKIMENPSVSLNELRRKNNESL